MTSAERQSVLLHILQATDAPTACVPLASLFRTTARTIDRDIDQLRKQGHNIETTPEGYRLRPPATVPSPSFTQPELQAILAGLAWVAADEDSQLSEAAEAASAKIETLLPPVASPSQPAPVSDAPLDIVRAAIQHECRLELAYLDAKGRATNRTIWPLDLDEYDESAMVAAWCEKRGDFRHFRLDRIQSMQLLDRYPTRRQTLLAKFHLQQDEGGW